MANQQYRIVSASESETHEEPHLPGSRITVRDIGQRVEERGDSLVRVAERFDIDLAAVYEALAYYHGNPEEMQQVEKRHERAVDVAKERSTLSPPD
jgi:uncharacterized protein (DUF433 family)